MVEPGREFETVHCWRKIEVREGGGHTVPVGKQGWGRGRPHGGVWGRARLKPDEVARGLRKKGASR